MPGIYTRHRHGATIRETNSHRGESGAGLMAVLAARELADEGLRLALREAGDTPDEDAVRAGERVADEVQAALTGGVRDHVARNG